MLTPTDCKNLIDTDKHKLDMLERKIDAEIRNHHGDYPWEEALLDCELSLMTRNSLAKRYTDAGWNYVYHHTSSENGERYGLTSFVFSMDPIKHCERSTWYRVVRDDCDNENLAD